ncbi:unnamed protein product, partial [Adineta ricciae]
MSTPHSFEQNLLTHLTHLKRIDFCVHSGFMNIEIDRRQTFDNWTKNQVISILHRRQFHTRFTLPFAFDRLEHVCNVLILTPSSALFYSHSFSRYVLVYVIFNLFKNYCHFSDDLIQNTTLTLPTVNELCLGNVVCSIDFPTLRRVLCLIPNLKHLTAKRCHINVIDTMNNDTNAACSMIDALCQMDPQAIPKRIYLLGGYYNINYMQLRNQIDVMHENSKSVLKANVTLPPDNFDHFVSLVKLNLIGFNTQRKTFEGGNKEEQDDDKPNDFVF